MITNNQRLAGIVATVAFLLCIPFIAMQFTSEVNWNRFDFFVAGILLLGTGLFIELFLRFVHNKTLRIGLIAVAFIVLALVWAELAVGIFGTRFAGS